MSSSNEKTISDLKEKQEELLTEHDKLVEEYRNTGLPYRRSTTGLTVTNLFLQHSNNTTLGVQQELLLLKADFERHIKRMEDVLDGIFRRIPEIKEENTEIDAQIEALEKQAVKEQEKA